MKGFWDKIDGYKTYIGVACYFAIGGALYLGLISEKDAVLLGTFVTGWTGYAIRTAIKKLE